MKTRKSSSNMILSVAWDIYYSDFKKGITIEALEKRNIQMTKKIDQIFQQNKDAKIIIFAGAVGQTLLNLFSLYDYQSFFPEIDL